MALTRYAWYPRGCSCELYFEADPDQPDVSMTPITGPYRDRDGAVRQERPCPFHVGLTVAARHAAVQDEGLRMSVMLATYWELFPEAAVPVVTGTPAGQALLPREPIWSFDANRTLIVEGLTLTPAQRQRFFDAVGPRLEIR